MAMATGQVAAWRTADGAPHAFQPPRPPLRSGRPVQPVPLSHVPFWRGGDHGTGHLLRLWPADHRLAAAHAEARPADPRGRAGGTPTYQEEHANHGRRDDP